MFRQQFRPAVLLFVALSALTGLVYPFVVTLAARAAFPQQAAGSFVERAGQPVGSRLIGQPFTRPGYFRGRPSATAPMPYNASASSGSNYAPTNPALADAVHARIATLRAADPDNPAPVPQELVTASASGLDPEIGTATAEYQVARVARSRGLAPERVRALVAEHTTAPIPGLADAARVNVLELNLALDALAPMAP